MTIRELIADLEEFDPDAEIGLSSSPGNELEIVATYADEKGKVWVDLEEKDA